jgi:hypothetical protein
VFEEQNRPFAGLGNGRVEFVDMGQWVQGRHRELSILPRLLAGTRTGVRHQDGA